MKTHLIRLVLILILCNSAFSFTKAQVKAKKVQSRPVAYPEEHALECIQDYYEFYNADEHYSNPKVRRVSGNVFYVSVKYCTGGKDVCYTKENIGTYDKPFYIDKPNEFFWHSKVLVLTCASQKKYTVRIKNIGTN